MNKDFRNFVGGQIGWHAKSLWDIRTIHYLMCRYCDATLLSCTMGDAGICTLQACCWLLNKPWAMTLKNLCSNCGQLRVRNGNLYPLCMGVCNGIFYPLGVCNGLFNQLWGVRNPRAMHWIIRAHDCLIIAELSGWLLYAGAIAVYQGVQLLNNPGSQWSQGCGVPVCFGTWAMAGMNRT